MATLRAWTVSASAAWMLGGCGGAEPPVAPAAAPEEVPAPSVVTGDPAPSPDRCPLVLAVGEIVAQDGPLSRDLAGPDHRIDYAAHAREIAVALHALFEDDLSARPEPDRRGDSLALRGPWPTAPYPCIEAIERLDFDQGGSAIVVAELQLAGALEVEVTLWNRDGWRARTLPDVSGARSAQSLAGFLAVSPEVDLVSATDRAGLRVMRVRDAGGSTICVVREDREPLCWRDPRAITVLAAGTWSEPDDDGDHDSDDDSDDDSDHDSDHDHEPAEAPPLLELVLGPWSDVAEIWHLDVDASTRRTAGTVAMTVPPVPPGPFWSPAAPSPSATPARALGAWEPVTAIDEPPWLAVLTSLDVSVVPSSAGIPAVLASPADGGGLDRTLCARHLGSWRCGAFEVTREDWELERTVDRVEPLGDALLVQSSMRMDGGNGEDSGAYGSAELYVMVADEASLRVAGWIPLGGMEWVTENRCGEDDRCYFRSVQRGYYPWSVTGDCLALGDLRAERTTTDGGFFSVRSAGGRSTPTRRLRGSAALATVALGFPGDEAATALAPPTEDLSGTWRWEGARLERGRCD